VHLLLQTNSRPLSPDNVRFHSIQLRRNYGATTYAYDELSLELPHNCSMESCSTLAFLHVTMHANTAIATKRLCFNRFTWIHEQWHVWRFNAHIVAYQYAWSRRIVRHIESDTQFWEAKISLIGRSIYATHFQGSAVYTCDMLHVFLLTKLLIYYSAVTYWKHR